MREKNRTKADLLLIWVCIGFLGVMMLSVGVRYGTDRFFSRRIGSELRNLIFFDDETLQAKPKKTEESTAQQKKEPKLWELYPFPAEEAAPKTAAAPAPTLLEKYRNKISSVEAKMESFSTEHLMFYQRLTTAAKGYEAAVHWNFAGYTEYNGVITLSDGYLSAYYVDMDCTEDADSLAELMAFCRKKGTDLLYVQAPYKISGEDDVSGTVDYSNQNADSFLELAEERDIPTFDLRQQIAAEGEDYHALFYRTDHHWRVETALWAAKTLCEKLNEDYGFGLDTSLLEPARYNAEVYPEWFLGSQGKKVTLAITDPEDFVLLRPDFPTKLHYMNFDRHIDDTGDFDIMFDMSMLEEIDYYNKSPYHVYNYGDRPLIEIENLMTEDEHSVVLIHDSFSDPLISFLAMPLKNVWALDLRSFSGSVESYIEEKKPDLVIVLYNPGALGPIEWEGHKSLFDFR